MKLVNTELEGVYILENIIFSDDRGLFVKTFHKDFFENNKLCGEFKESYYSISKKDVIRGMHFQEPPNDHEKLVYVLKGKILDVIVDLRGKSKTFGHHISIELSEQNRLSVYIPKGFAHGFKSLEDGSITVYNVSSVYNQESDNGINYNSFNYDWKCIKPIMSERDRSFINLKFFNSPFK